MKIVEARATRIRVPLKGTFISSQNIRRDLHRTIVRLTTDSGLVGIGETVGTPEVYALVKRLLNWTLGRSFSDRAAIRTFYGSRLFQNMNGRNGWIAMGGVEMALWDLAGKALDLPVYALLGGPWRNSVPAVCEMSAAGFLPIDTSDEDARNFFKDPGSIERIVDCAAGLAKTDGYRTIKIKSLGRDADFDVSLFRAARETLGPKVSLRHDPNAAYNLATAITLCQQLEKLDLEWFEDPTTGLEGLRRIRSLVRTPVATNMFVIQLDQLVPAMRANAIDLVGADPFHWGGLAATQELYAACNGLGIEVFMHCMFELSIATAANVHVAASLPNMKRGMDTCLYIQEADIIEGGPLKVVDGDIAVPSGPGLGVSIDEAAIAAFKVEEFFAVP